MLAFGAALWIVALILLLWAWRRRRDRLPEVYRAFCRSGRLFVGIVPLALLAAAFLTPLVPAALIAEWLGSDAGVAGIGIAILAGWCLPVPPPVFFPIVAVLLKAGAGLPQLVALVVAWNVFALYRTLAIELPIMGRYFVGVRLLSSLALPPLAAAIALLIA